MPIYGLSAALLGWRWWPGRATNRDPLRTLAVVAFGVYFTASILGALVPLLSSPTATVSLPSPLDVLFLTSYALLGLFLWRLGSRSGGAGRRDILDTLIVVGGVAPVFWMLPRRAALRDRCTAAGAADLRGLPRLCLRPVLPDGPAGLRRASTDHAPPPARGVDRGRADRRRRLPVRQPERQLCLRAAVAGAVDRVRDLHRLPCPAPARRRSSWSGTRARTSTARDGCGCWPGAWRRPSSRSSTGS